MESDVNTVLWAVGRTPQTDLLEVGAAGLEMDKAGNLVVDDQQNTNVPGLYAVGDVAGKVRPVYQISNILYTTLGMPHKKGFF